MLLRNSPDVDGNTPLMLAAARGHADVCDLLVQQGARVEVRRCPDNRTTVPATGLLTQGFAMLCIRCFNITFPSCSIPCLSCVKIMDSEYLQLARKCRTLLTISLRRRWTALHIAAYHGHLKAPNCKSRPSTFTPVFIWALW